jgi:hypothetical protein
MSMSLPKKLFGGSWFLNIGASLSPCYARSFANVYTVLLREININKSLTCVCMLENGRAWDVHAPVNERHNHPPPTDIRAPTNGKLMWEVPYMIHVNRRRVTESEMLAEAEANIRKFGDPAYNRSPTI